MSRRALGALAVMTSVGLILAGPASGAPTAAPASETAVLQVDRAWADALAKRDGAALERILDERFVATFGAAEPLDKPGFIKLILASPADPTTTQDFSDRTVIVDGDTAVLVETDTLRHGAAGKVSPTVYRMTLTYIRRGGHWRALAEHLVEAKG